MKEYYNNCPYVCYSRAIGFMSKEPVPTCRRFYSNYIDNVLRGTFEKCCDIALSGKCLIPGAKEYEQHKIDLLTDEYQKNCEYRKLLKEKGYNTRPY